VHVRKDEIKEPFALTRRRRLGRHNQRNQEESSSGDVGIAFGIVLLQKRENIIRNIHRQFDELQRIKRLTLEPTSLKNARPR